MKQNYYIKISGLIFLLVAIMHVWRLVVGWEVQLGDYVIPFWASIVGVVIAGYLAYSSQKLKK